jgi:protein gp37
MPGKTSIEWTEYTWNPITGCTKVSPGCKNCYAERLAKRLQAMGQRHYLNGFNLELHHDSLEIPFNWKQPAVVFVNSMSDLFHEKVPLTFISKVFDVMSLDCTPEIRHFRLGQSDRDSGLKTILQTPQAVCIQEKNGAACGCTLPG